MLTDAPARRIWREDGRLVVEAGAADSFRRGLDPAAFDVAGRESYDAVVATVPSDVFLSLLDPGLRDEVGDGVRRARLAKPSTRRPCASCWSSTARFSPFYWTNVADDLPFIGLIEHTNFVPPERYAGRRFLYVANYVDRADPLLELDAG